MFHEGDVDIFRKLVDKLKKLVDKSIKSVDNSIKLVDKQSKVLETVNLRKYTAINIVKEKSNSIDFSASFVPVSSFYYALFGVTFQTRYMFIDLLVNPSTCVISA